MDKSVQVDFAPNPKADQFRKISGFDELTKDIYAKLDSIHTVLGYLLEKTKDLPEPVKNLGEQTDDDNLDTRETVLPVE